MVDNRIKEHPILPVPERGSVPFYWNGKKLFAAEGEVISSALFANGIKIFGHHHKGGSAQGIYCANGQCAKCTVIADGIPVKSCMTEVTENMQVKSVEGLPVLPDTAKPAETGNIEVLNYDVLIIGGGPAGLSAAIQLGENGVNTLLVDDKSKLGGKLVLQTHKFFGSVEDSYAGTRGNDIGKMLAETVMNNENIDVWTSSTALYVFKDKKVGIIKDGVYKLVEPKIVLNAAGAREKFLRFKGNTLSGIYGAGAFQTLVNRDLVRPTKRLFIVGGGNVGLIAGYHALQAGIEVVGLVEALPKCGGYKVHADKLKRLGVPIYTSHTVLKANGEESVESVTICRIDKNFQPIAGTEKTFECDTVLIAVGLESVNEFVEEARTAGIKVFAAGDALEIAEASSAMFNGKIMGLKIAKEIGADVEDIPESWYKKAAILKSHPGDINPQKVPENETGVMPIIHCIQEIPCNPCSTICPTNSINMQGDPIMGLPEYEGKCIGCKKCVAICPGLAITLVDFRKDAQNPVVTVPYEVGNMPVKDGDFVTGVDIDGNDLGSFEVTKVMDIKSNNRTQLIDLKIPKNAAKKVVSFQIQEDEISKETDKKLKKGKISDAEMVCLCERVSAEEVRELIKKGITDLNQIKAITRAGMGPCGAKTCDNLIKQIFRQEGIPLQEIEENTRRPLFVEVPMGKFTEGEKL
ncbi:MAG: FAD-dependent oxidoreductase [Candidatus Cloacimonetes bacterium]|nr:FAD-dependent oxidoreductase [Candidatus Cloacimonadota bacterium]MCF7814878.1 FAD-dependent oxidoreductase [Candidatus Cloacimonadota bacterium]MCF7868153.1 FAD-dependent oxidoreductase [Candidatus Cloacimonadota bacterium]MCF7884573.1 FAD-dependent oxidoreductase [Candidatus Cloacimonadota bacterium]